MATEDKGLAVALEEIFDTVKAVFCAFSESVKYIRSRKCRKIIESFLEQFQSVVAKIDSMPKNNIEAYLNLLNGILQTINSTLASSICH
ncbi:MAG: hypothetical protein QXG08_06725 [Candidatus Methanomethyliaceae archaeon]